MGLLKKTAEQAAEPKATAAPPAGDEPQPEQGSAATPESEGDWPSHLAPEQQDEFEGAVTALYDVLYKNPETSKAVAEQLVSDEDPQIKAEAAARAATLIISQLDQKLNVSNETMPFFILTVVDAVLEMADAKGIQFDENDTEAVLEATAEGVQALNGEAQQPPPGAASPAPGGMNGPQ